jgi:hypothetical protein
MSVLVVCRIASILVLEFNLCFFTFPVLFLVSQSPFLVGILSLKLLKAKICGSSQLQLLFFTSVFSLSLVPVVSPSNH